MRAWWRPEEVAGSCQVAVPLPITFGLPESQALPFFKADPLPRLVQGS